MQSYWRKPVTEKEDGPAPRKGTIRSQKWLSPPIRGRYSIIVTIRRFWTRRAVTRILPGFRRVRDLCDDATGAHVQKPFQNVVRGTHHLVKLSCVL